jgi:hypothetical protein
LKNEIKAHRTTAEDADKERLSLGIDKAVLDEALNYAKGDIMSHNKELHRVRL